MDTVKLSFRVDPNQSLTHAAFWARTSSQIRPGTHVEDETHIGFVHFPNGNARVTLFAQNQVCHVEFNAARLIHGKSTRLLPVADLQKVVEGVIREVSRYSGPDFIHTGRGGLQHWEEDWPGRVTIKRLDVARNFIVSDAALIKRVLPAIPCRYGRSRAEHTNSTAGWTLSNSTRRSGQDRLYDKQAELANRSIECSVTEGDGRLFRFEAELQGHRLKTYGLTKLRDVSTEASWKALEARWHAVRWGSPLPGGSGIMTALRPLKALQQRRMLGDLHLAAAGMAKDVLTPAQYKRFQADARKLGLTPGMPVELLGEPEQYLDLVEGRLMPLGHPSVTQLVDSNDETADAG
ncbi:hypothetical protein [Tessaracoccus sp. MC1756]|uniref:hypothetical protein n=1 Tax=Tessaracoccus sp. MC1756 TaxID=2760311 RepID=UPI0016025F2D|nr:hypothetical protein [Tessaracoccus sp. MC1756]MBB1510666.1 hypothetical protein [Tessaracoccus sp. MC1756]